MSVQASKFLSLLLRHSPEEIGLVLSQDGWASISDLIQLTQNGRVSFSRELIEELVRTSDKKRFVLSEDGERIRANQGHSIEVDLGLVLRRPPAVLYHGTATRFLDSILAQGLLRRDRQHVHLSVDVETALKVGKRHGRPVILRVDALGLYETGAAFFLSENGVWLTDFVPASYLSAA